MTSIDLSAYKSPREAAKALEARRKEIEREFQRLRELLTRGEISQEEFEERRRKLEREFIEVMDRLVQVRFLMSR